MFWMGHVLIWLSTLDERETAVVLYHHLCCILRVLARVGSTMHVLVPCFCKTVSTLFLVAGARVKLETTFVGP